MALEFKFAQPVGSINSDALPHSGIRGELLAVRSVELNVVVQYVFQFSRGDAMDWTTMLAYITGSVDQELLQRNEYLAAENRIARNQLQFRLRVTDGERRTLAEIGKQHGKRALERVASIVRPETILGWHRKLVARKFDGSKNRAEQLEEDVLTELK